MPSVDSIHSIYLSMRESLARAVVGIVPPKEIEDIVQETYVRVCQIKKKDNIGEPRAFLFKIARNLALDNVKRAESRLAFSVEQADESGFGEAERLADETFDQVASNEEFSQFCDAVRQLPVRCRRAFVLKKVYGHSQREIARKMKISESTVEKHIAHGIKRCAYLMMQHNEEYASGNRVNKQGGVQSVSAPGRRDRS